MRHTLFSELSPSECIETFAGSVTPDRTPLPDQAKPFLGKVDGQQFRLRILPVRRNSWAPVFSGTFREHAGGTLIEGRFGFGSFGRAFMLIWSAFLVIMLLAVAFALSQALSPGLFGGGSDPVQGQGNAFPEYLRGLVWLLVLGLAGAGVMGYGKHLARGEKEIILQFLQDTLDACPYETHGAG
jgi:hypothetical protein